MAVVDQLPFKLAIRTVLSDVWYSNALPEWYTPEYVDENPRVTHLKKRASRYLDGDTPPPAFSLPVPRLTEGTRKWVVPAVNDQFIMQACVSNLAAAVAKDFDRTRVFSCQPNDNPNVLAFMKPQIAALLEFDKETTKRLKSGDFVLELDIEKAFASIDRTDFFDFVERLKPKGVEVKLLRHLVTAWSGEDAGIPLINDSIFFLGSAYLTRVDSVISKITDSFIRYMDDYRIFAKSESELEHIYEQVSQGLLQIGFKLNSRKVRIGSEKEFLQPAPDFARARSRYAIQLDQNISSQISPELLATLVARSLEKPNTYLNEGFGRYLLGALRRYRLNDAIYRRAQESSEFSARLTSALSVDKTIQLTSARLNDYSAGNQDTWRLIWVIYVIEQEDAAHQFESQLTQIEQNADTPMVAKLWARRCRLRVGGEPSRLPNDLLDDLSYLEAGQHCYGEQICKGEGF